MRAGFCDSIADEFLLHWLLTGQAMIPIGEYSPLKISSEAVADEEVEEIVNREFGMVKKDVHGFADPNSRSRALSHPRLHNLPKKASVSGGRASCNQSEYRNAQDRQTPGRPKNLQAAEFVTRANDSSR